MVRAIDRCFKSALLRSLQDKSSSLSDVNLGWSFGSNSFIILPVKVLEPSLQVLSIGSFLKYEALERFTISRLFKPV